MCSILTSVWNGCQGESQGTHTLPVGKAVGYLRSTSGTLFSDDFSRRLMAAWLQQRKMWIPIPHLTMLVMAGSFPWCPYYTHDLIEAPRTAFPAHKSCAGKQAVCVTSKVALVSHVPPLPNRLPIHDESSSVLPGP